MRLLLLLLLVPSVFALTLSEDPHESSSAFTFVTFNTSAPLSTNTSSHDSSSSFVFVTFVKYDSLSSLDALHASHAGFSFKMTNGSSVLLSSPDLAGRFYSDSFVVSTTAPAANFTVRVLERRLNDVVDVRDYFVPLIYSNYTLSLWNGSGEFIAYLDVNEEVIESNETNNVIRRVPGPKVYLSYDFEYPFAWNVFEEYLTDKGYDLVKYPYQADLILHLAEPDPATLPEFGLYTSGVRFYDRFCSKPYCGYVAFKYVAGKKHVYIDGLSWAALVTGVKRFASGYEQSFIGPEDLDAVKVYDYFSMFSLPMDASVVKNALDDKMVRTTQLETASSTGVPLRLLHIEREYSNPKLKEYLVNSTLPVVLAQGLWSNLYSWMSFGVELADSGRDVYLIEITGGPGQDCSDCPNYDFSDLTDDYWPALISKVKSESGSERLQYVGFSNGCRTALSSLQKGMVDTTQVETFVGVGCPGAFEGISVGELIINPIDEKATNILLGVKNHVSFSDLVLAGFFKKIGVTKEVEKISLNLWKNYDFWMFDNSDAQPGSFITNNFFIIQGTAFITNDMIVTTADEKAIYDSINSLRMKAYFSLIDTHSGLTDNKKAKSLIKKSLNKENYTWWQLNAELKEMQVKE